LGRVGISYQSKLASRRPLVSDDDKKNLGAGGKRMYRAPLDGEWVRALLHTAPGRVPESLQEGFGTVTTDEFLKQTRSLLEKAVQDAQEALDKHPFTETIAREAAKRLGKRGQPRLVVDPDGSVVLEIHYRGGGGNGIVDSEFTPEPKAKRRSRPRPPVIDPALDDRRTWSSKLPSLTELREKAAEMGLDISGCGRSKKKILIRITDAEGQEPYSQPPPQKKRTKTALAIGPTTIVNLEPPGATPNPEPPKAPTILEPPEPPEPEPPDAPSKPKPRSMAALAAVGEKIDIDEVLSPSNEDDDHDEDDLGLDNLDDLIDAINSHEDD